MRPQAGVAPTNPTDAVRFVDLAVRSILQGAIPFVLVPSSYMANNGVVIIGQRPASSATVTFSATSGAGVTATFSAATLGGSSALDTGRVLTILDTTYKFFTVTGNSGNSTTVCQGTVSGGTLSTVGAFANTALWLSNNPTGSVSGYGTPLPRAVGNSYSSFPAGAISTGSAAGVYWTNWSSSTVGQTYNNVYSTGYVSQVASPTAFATTGPGAFSAAAGTWLQGPVGTLLGNSMLANGSLETMLLASTMYNGNTRQVKCTINSLATRYGQAVGLGGSPPGSITSLTNQGVTNSQISNLPSAGGGDFAGSIIATVTTVDTTVNQPVGIAFNASVATDYIILERYSVKLYPN